MGKKNKRSSHDDANRKKPKISPFGFQVEIEHASSSKSLKTVQGEGVLAPCSESNVKLKEQERKSEVRLWGSCVINGIDFTLETKELTKAINELTTTIKKLQETLQTKPDLLELEENDDTQEKLEDEDACCFGCEDAKGDDQYTIFVKGFERVRPRNEIKKRLTSVFGKCGKIARVFVPFECETQLPLGYAFINFKFETSEKVKESIDKALEFNGHCLEGRQLLVTMGSKRGETYGYTNFSGCKRCNATPYGYGVSRDYRDYDYILI